MAEDRDSKEHKRIEGKIDGVTTELKTLNASVGPIIKEYEARIAVSATAKRIGDGLYNLAKVVLALVALWALMKGWFYSWLGIQNLPS